MADTTQIEIKQKTKDGLVKIHPITDASAVQTTNSTTIQQELDNAVPLVAGDNITIAPTSNGLVISAQGGDLSNYVTKTSLNTTLGGYAKLSSNNAFTGSNSFSGAIAVDTINSKATGNSIARMYYDTDKAYKVLLGTVARQVTLLGSSDRPYYAKGGEAFNAHELALKEDIPTVLSGYAKLSGSNAFTGSNDFNTDGRVLSIKDGNFCSNESFIPLRTISNNRNFGIRGLNGTVYNLDEFPTINQYGALRYDGWYAQQMLGIAAAGGDEKTVKYCLLATMRKSDGGSWNCVNIKGRIGGWGVDSVNVDIRVQGRDGPYIIGTIQGMYSGNIGSAFNICDIVVNQNVDETFSIWLCVKGYYSYALDIRGFGPDSLIKWTGNLVAFRGGTEKTRLSTSSYVMKVYGSSTAQTGDVNIPSGSIYKINGENMCNYRRLSARAKLDSGAQGSASVTAYGLYVNNVLVKIIGYYTAAVALDTGATGITFIIGWDRQQPSDFQSIGLSYLSEKENLRRVTTDTWHCEVWINAAYHGGNNVRFMLV